MRQHTKIRSFESEIIHAHTYLVIDTYSFSIFLMLVIFSNAREGGRCLAPRGQEAHNGAIRSGTRYAKWAGGSRSQTHRRAAIGGFTQGDGYVRGVAPTLDRSSGSFSTSSSRLFGQTPILPYNRVLDTVTGTGPIPPVTVSRVNAYSWGALARALPEGLRYLST